MPSGTVVYESGGGGRQAAKAQARALELQRQQDQARNNQLMAILKKQQKRQKTLMKKARKSMVKSGKARRAEIREQAVKTEALGSQRLISRGLGNTTVRSSFERGVAADKQKQLTLQKDLQAQRMAGLFSQEAGMQIPQGQLHLQGTGMQSGGLQDYLKLIMMLQGGLS
jgi:hypothetical protein